MASKQTISLLARAQGFNIKEFLTKGGTMVLPTKGGTMVLPHNSWYHGAPPQRVVPWCFLQRVVPWCSPLFTKYCFISRIKHSNIMYHSSLNDPSVCYVMLSISAGEDVVKRLQETFDRYASNTGLLPRATFLRDIFGDGMPPKLAEVIN